MEAVSLAEQLRPWIIATRSVNLECYILADTTEPDCVIWLGKGAVTACTGVRGLDNARVGPAR